MDAEAQDNSKANSELVVRAYGHTYDENNRALITNFAVKELSGREKEIFAYPDNGNITVLFNNSATPPCKCPEIKTTRDSIDTSALFSVALKIDGVSASDAQAVSSANCFNLKAALIKPEIPGYDAFIKSQQTANSIATTATLNEKSTLTENQSKPLTLGPDI